MAARTQHQFSRGDWVRVARPISGNTDLQDQVLEVVEVVGKSAVLKERGKRRVVGVEQLEPIQQAREWQVGDRVEGENPEGKTLRGEIAAIGDRWLRIGPSPKDAVAVATARLLESIPHSDASESTAVAVEIVEADPTARLAQLEDEIRQGMAQVEAGAARSWAAVAAIKAEDLWKIGGYKSFAAYCKDKFDWQKTNAYDALKAGVMRQALLDSGVEESELPTSLMAMRELAKVEPEQRAEVVQQASASAGGPPTAKAIKAAAAPKVDSAQESANPFNTMKNGGFVEVDPFDFGRLQELLVSGKAKGLEELSDRWRLSCGNEYLEFCQYGRQVLISSHHDGSCGYVGSSMSKGKVQKLVKKILKAAATAPRVDPDAMAEREGAKLEAEAAAISAGDYVSPTWDEQEVGVVERVRDVRDPLSRDLVVKWLTHTGQSLEHSKQVLKLSPDNPLVVKALARRAREDARLGLSDGSESEDTEPTCLDASGQPIAVDDVVLTAADRELLGQVTAIEPDDFLPITVRTAGGITRVKAESLLVAPQEMVDSLIEQAKRKASEPGDDQSTTENPAPVVEAPRGAWKVGDVVVDEYRPYSPMAIAKVSDTQACCWTQLDEMWIGWDRLRPYDGPAEACSLAGIVRYRLEQLVKVGGKAAIAQLLEEV